MGRSGGLEGVFDNLKEFEVELEKDTATVRDVIEAMKQKHLKGNPDFFYEKGTV